MKTSCNVVQDVFVLYQDGALSEETRLEVKNHLRKCRDCRAFYQEMKSGYGRSSGRRGASLVMKPEAELSFENVAQRLRKAKVKNSIISNSAWGAAVLCGVLLTLAAYRSHIKNKNGGV
ncbi:MAG: zf-HC2 domain-containing protein [Clostridiales bacterium]|nr:zf-HC2 domain-containing protein [Clostridiales bacterium]